MFWKLSEQSLTLLTFNHPTAIMFIKLSELIIASLGLENVQLAAEAYPNFLYSNAYWPTYPGLNIRGGINPQANFIFKSPDNMGKRILNLEEFIAKSYANYKSFPSDKVIKPHFYDFLIDRIWTMQKITFSLGYKPVHDLVFMDEIPFFSDQVKYGGFKPTTVNFQSLTALICDLGRDCTPEQFMLPCNDPLKTCTGHTIGEINHEYDDGRRYQDCLRTKCRLTCCPRVLCAWVRCPWWAQARLIIWYSSERQIAARWIQRCFDG